MQRAVATLIVGALILAACGGSAESNEDSEPPTTTASTPVEPATPTTTTSISTTTTVAPTTSTVPEFDFTYPIAVYDLFEATEELQPYDPCIAIGPAIGISEGHRIVIRDDVAATAVATTSLLAGRIRFDQSGPEPSERGSDIFYYCEFLADFAAVALQDGPLYVLELPGDLGLTNALTKDDLLGDRFTSLTVTEPEEERQRLRAES